jgi:eukaryotic-like serine/threonine-protein kinase
MKSPLSERIVSANRHHWLLSTSVGQASQPERANLRYRLAPRPLGQGSYATVFSAEHRITGETVALKRAKAGRMAAARIKREIEAQQSLARHPNIMPILDHDPAFLWYTMPVARGALITLRKELDEDSFASIILDLADALAVAHQQNMVHRDVAPTNILALEGSRPGGSRWVIADWGMVSLPFARPSQRLTRTGVAMGTAGFDAPELSENPSAASASTDVYSLGRVVAWFLTGTWPRSGRLLLPDGPALRWRVFVRNCTEEAIEQRIRDMHALREALNDVFTIHDEPPSQRTKYLLDRVLSGDTSQLEELVTMGLAHQDDPVIYLDHLALLPTGLTRTWATESPEQAAEVGRRMAEHLLTSQWGDRDTQYVRTPLSFIHTIIQALIDIGQLGLAQDVVVKFFAADEQWRYEPQRQRTIEWLADLEAPADTTVAQVLLNQDRLIAYYQSDIQPKSTTLRTILASTNEAVS